VAAVAAAAEALARQIRVEGQVLRPRRRGGGVVVLLRRRAEHQRVDAPAAAVVLAVLRELRRDPVLGVFRVQFERNFECAGSFRGPTGVDEQELAEMRDVQVLRVLAALVLRQVDPRRLVRAVSGGRVLEGELDFDHCLAGVVHEVLDLARVDPDDAEQEVARHAQSQRHLRVDDAVDAGANVRGENLRPPELPVPPVRRQPHLPQRTLLLQNNLRVKHGSCLYLIIGPLVVE